MQPEGPGLPPLATRGMVAIPMPPDARRVGKAAPHVLFCGFFCLYRRQGAMKKSITITVTVTVDTNEPRRTGEGCCMDGMSAEELRGCTIGCSSLHLGTCPRSTKPSRGESWSESKSKSVCGGEST
jgi:hypothetical protein